MNKKVILSVLSTALVTSMATSAFAASGGIYIGGNVDRFYSDEAFIKQNAMLVADLYDSGLENVENSVLYVNWDGKVATLQEMMDAKLAGKEAEYKTVTSEDFEKIGGEEGFYAVSDKGEVSTVKEMQPEQKPLTPEAILKQAEEAVAAYEAAALDTPEAIAKAEALGETAVAKVSAVADADKKAALEARVAKKKAAVDAAKAGDLKVESVSAINLKQIKVNFTKAIDEASIAGKFTVDDPTNSIKDVALSDDKTSVVLTLDKAIKNQTGKVSVTVSGKIKDTAGVELGEDFTLQNISLTDLTLPTVSTVKTVGNKKLEVVFSEPVQGNPVEVPSSYTIDGQLFSATSVKLDDTGTKLTIELANALTAGEHTLKVKANVLEDYANLKNVELESKFSVDGIVTAPTATLVSASTTAVTVKFDREVKTTPVVKFGAVSATSVEQDRLDKTKYTATFATNFPNAGGEIVIAKGIEDFYGNKTTEDIKISFKPEIDTEKPFVNAITADSEEKIVVSFNEKVKLAGAKVTLKNKDGKLISIQPLAFEQVSGTNDETKLVVKLPGSAKFNPEESPFKLSISEIKDLAGNPMDAVVDHLVIVPDKTAPEVVSKIKDSAKSKVVIAFNEKLDLTSATNVASFKYAIANKGIYNLPAGATVDLDATGKSVVFTFPTSWKQGNTPVSTADVASIYLAGIKDLAGNTIDDQAVSLDGAVAETLATVEKAEAVDAKTIQITLSKDGGVPSILYAGDFEITVGGKSATAANATIDGRVITLTLANELQDKSVADVKVKTIAKPVGTETALGNVFVINTDAPVADKIAPSLIPVEEFEVGADGSSVAITFDEALTVNETVAAQALTIKDSKGNVLIPGTDYKATVSASSSDTITLVFEQKGLNDVLSIALLNNNSLKDKNGNLANNFNAISTNKEVVVAQTPANNAPTVATALEDKTGTVGTPVTVDASGTFTDADGDALTLTAASDDTGIATVKVTNTNIEVTPVAKGTATITVTATDGKGGTVSETFTITVSEASNTNNAPTVAIALENQTGTVGTPVTVDASGTFTDADGDALTLTVSSDDTGIATVTVTNTNIEVTPVAKGTTTITVTATDGKGGTVSETFDITVS
ncbi:Ig-like domain-containing protein [Brevibacillus laterosporus]|uniref:Ig-like domain-containing protein n=1 Tax=Brevibacillus laterosporus TaxID=1465 RepID=UPI001EF16D02|nr:Ig-like domain-containing protein [Brevibacillus laterosporus]MCG7315699.1 hypothetical protein [Brevibacillus laterosporus]